MAMIRTGVWTLVLVLMGSGCMIGQTFKGEQEDTAPVLDPDSGQEPDPDTSHDSSPDTGEAPNPDVDSDGDGLSPAEGDCDDTNDAVFPGADEVCNGVDDDCDGGIDDDDPEGPADPATWFADADGDGWGDASSSIEACTQPAGMVADNIDCYDNAADSSHPAGPVEGWPRIADYYLDYYGSSPSLCQVAAHSVVLDQNGLSDLASDYGMSEEEVRAQLDTLNPDLVVLREWPFSYFWPGSEQDPNGGSGWDPAWLVKDNSGAVVEVWGGQYMPNLTNSDLRDWLVDWIVTESEDSGRWSSSTSAALYDGLFFDVLSAGVDILNDATGDCSDLDLGLGISATSCDDYLEAWSDGVEALWAGLADALPGVPLYLYGWTVDGSRIVAWEEPWGHFQPYQWQDARENESSREWRGYLYRERSRSSVVASSFPGTVTQMSGNSSYTDYSYNSTLLTSVEQDYARMRYGLTSALLAGTAYSYEYGQARFGEGWWYDEYDNAGQGPGYLGQPLGPPRPMTEPSGTLVMDQELEAGIENWLAWGCDFAECEAALAEFTVSANWETSDCASSSSGCLRFDVTSSTGVDYWEWHVLGYHCGLALDASTTYTLEFQARADTLRRVQPYLYDHSADTYQGWEYDIVLTQEWQSFILQVDETDATSDGCLYFVLGTHDGSVWFDDFQMTAGATSGTWAREFDNGLVLVNASGSDETLALDATYTHINGTEDPTLNDGSSVTSVTVPAWDGMILLK